jgi:RHS repeat-associated protein
VDRLGRQRNFTYDSDNRLTQETWVESGTAVNTLTYGFDNNGNVTAASEQKGANSYSYTYAYDAGDRVTVQQGPFGLTLTYAYDSVGNQTQVQDSKGGTTTSAYDAANRLTMREYNGTSQTTVLRFDQTWTADDQLQTVKRYSDLAGGTLVGVTTYSYDNADRVTNIHSQDGSANPQSNITYAYDSADRVTTQTSDGAAPVTYTYDADNQLLTDTSTTYSYDAAGNRNMTGYTVGADNQVSTDGTWNYTYDAEGNLAKKVLILTGETWTYGYDERNQMAWAEDRASDGGTLLQREDFTYDVLGNLIQTTVGSLTTRYGLDTGTAEVWSELDGTNALQTRLIRPDSVDGLAAKETSAGTVSWYLQDRLGSVVAFTSLTGTVLDKRTYDGFGKIATETVPLAGDHWGYTGKLFESTVGLQYNIHRWYNPATGTWTTQDDIRFRAGDYNLGRYVGNDATNATDPSGLEPPRLTPEEIQRSLLLGGGLSVLPGSSVKTTDVVPSTSRKGDRLIVVTDDSFRPPSRPTLLKGDFGGWLSLGREPRSLQGPGPTEFDLAQRFQERARAQAAARSQLLALEAQREAARERELAARERELAAAIDPRLASEIRKGWKDMEDLLSRTPGISDQQRQFLTTLIAPARYLAYKENMSLQDALQVLSVLNPISTELRSQQALAMRNVPVIRATTPEDEAREYQAKHLILGRAFLEQSRLKGASPIDECVISQAHQIYVEEARQRRAAMSPGDQLISLIMEAVLFELAAGGIGLFAGGTELGAVGRTLARMEKAELKALGLEVRGGELALRTGARVDAAGLRALGLEVREGRLALAPLNNGGVLNAGRYAQTSYSNTFSAEGIRIYSRLAGRPINTIEDLVGAIRAGHINPSDIPVNYIVRPGGNTLILNTRTAQALEQAGIPRSQWNAVNQTGNADFERLLSGQLQRNNLTNTGTANPVLDRGR